MMLLTLMLSERPGTPASAADAAHDEFDAHAKLAGRRDLGIRSIHWSIRTMIDCALSRASQALACASNSSCAASGCLKPGFPGLSDNIRVKKHHRAFLEHGRIVCFGNGHGLPSPQSKVYISSAGLDATQSRPPGGRHCSDRKSDRAIQQVQDQIMVALLKDQAQSWHMSADGTYARDLEPRLRKHFRRILLHDESLALRSRPRLEDAAAASGGCGHARS